MRLRTRQGDHCTEVLRSIRNRCLICNSLLPVLPTFIHRKWQITTLTWEGRYLSFVIQYTSVNVIPFSISPILVSFCRFLYCNSCFSFALFSARALFLKSCPWLLYIYSSHFLFLERRLFHLHISFISAFPWFSLMGSYFNFNFSRFLLVLWFLLFTKKNFHFSTWMNYNTKCANIVLLDRLALNFNEAKLKLEKSDESLLTICRTYKRETVYTLNTQT